MPTNQYIESGFWVCINLRISTYGCIYFIIGDMWFADANTRLFRTLMPSSSHRYVQVSSYFVFLDITNVKSATPCSWSSRHLLHLRPPDCWPAWSRLCGRQTELRWVLWEREAGARERKVRLNWLPIPLGREGVIKVCLCGKWCLKMFYSRLTSYRLVLRTHTTSVSAAMLHKLAAKKGPDGRVPPARYFSIDRVFR